ncbi:MAG: MFS transporter [Coriobacteriia bacterium]|nr:MFS transporter [Coriobacteriia bacterium]
MEKTSNNGPAGQSNPQLVFTLILASFVTSFASSSLNVSIKVIGEEFHVPTATLGWLVTAFTICSVALILPLGRLGDLSSRRSILNVGIGLFSLSSAALVFAPSLGVMIGLRVCQGLGSAAMLATNQAIMVDAFPVEVRGRMLGISTSAVYFGLALGPIIGGFVTEHFGWRYVFALMAVLGGVSFVLAFGRLPANSSHVETNRLASNLDIVGILLFMTSVSTLSWGTNSLSSGNLAYIAITYGVLALGCFAWWQGKAQSPLLKPGLFQGGHGFAFANLSVFLNHSATMSITYLTSIYLQQAKGFGSDQAGLVLVTAPLVQAVFSIMAGRLSDKFSPFRLASIGCVFCTASLVAFSFISTQSGLLQIILSLVLNGIGFGFFGSPMTNAVMGLVDRSDVGTASAFMGTMRNLGQITSMSVITIVASMKLSNQALSQVSPTDLSAMMRLCYLVFTVICLLSLVASLQAKANPSDSDYVEKP